MGLSEKRLYQSRLELSNQAYMIPSSADQAAVMEVIYGIKSGDQTTSADRMVRLAAKLSQDGADVCCLDVQSYRCIIHNSRRRVIMS